MFSNTENIIPIAALHYRLYELRNLESLTQEEAYELATLITIETQCAPYGDAWYWGSLDFLVKDSYMVMYAQTEGAVIAGLIEPPRPWPLNCIDWSLAAQKLRDVYVSVDFEGAQYWMRDPSNAPAPSARKSR